MAFVDEIQVHMSAGRGGNGVVRWLHEKGRKYGGPAGGDGGKGGDVYIMGVSDIGLLASYRHEKYFNAGNGQDGAGKSMKGKNGEDFIFKVPVGSVVKNQNTGEIFDVVQKDLPIKILQGGRGGFGNEHFKSSTNQNPFECTEGGVGEEADFSIELNLIADAGFIGLPNAGKSSLLNALTKANAKVGNFKFTTLDPNLGAFYGHILADIPGIIEGASEGKGLGSKFLRHIKRTKILIHCISLESQDILFDYQTIRKELETYSKDLASKQEFILLTKSDLVENDLIDQVKSKLAQYTYQEIMHISILDDQLIKNLADKLSQIL